jgi:hypothetical protein
VSRLIVLVGLPLRYRTRFRTTVHPRRRRTRRRRVPTSRIARQTARSARSPRASSPGRGAPPLTPPPPGVIDHRPVSSSCLIVPIGMPPLEPTSVIAP